MMRSAVHARCLGALLLGLEPLRCLAADATSVANSTELEEVVVTAQRREENLQTVPVAVTALSGEQLTRLQVTDTEGLSQFVPSLHIYSENIGTEFYTIRGIGRTSEDLSADPGVAVFMNDQYLPRQAEANAALYDVDRVEVLKGPQGTLYGKNATAGAINIITRDPTDELSGYAELTGGNYGRVNVDAAISGPISDGVRGRLAVDSENRNGIYHNLATGATDNNIDMKGVRGTLQFLSHERLTVSVITDWERTIQDGNAKTIFTDVPGTFYEFFTRNPFTGQVRPGLTLQTQPPDPLTTASGIDGNQGLETYGGVVNVRYELSGLDFLSTTGARVERDYSTEDVGRVPEISAYTTSNENTWSATQEFRLVSTEPNKPGSTNRISWTAGVYFFHEQGSKLAGIYYNVVPFSAITYFDQGLHTNSLAGFGEIRYRVLDRLSVTAGLRYTDETKSFDVNAFSIPIPGVPGSDGSTPFLDNGNFMTHSSDRWGKLSPKFVAAYEFSDAQFLYASVTEGFKSGGFAGEPSSPPNTEFAPEEVTNYEVGFKGEFLERRLRANLAVFYSDYTHMQLQTFNSAGLPETGTADARSKGVEVELLARPIRILSFSVGASFIDPTYKNFVSQLPAIGTLYDRSGQTIGEVPKRQVNALMDLTIPLGDYGSIDVLPDVVSIGETITEYGSLWSPAYTKGDLRVVWNAPGGRTSATLWANNLTNVVYYQGGGAVSKYNTDLVRVGLVTDPRTYGATIRYQF